MNKNEIRAISNAVMIRAQTTYTYCTYMVYTLDIILERMDAVIVVQNRKGFLMEHMAAIIHSISSLEALGNC